MPSVLALLSVSFIWGLYYLATDHLLDSGWNGEWMNALRFIIGGTSLLLLLFFLGKGEQVVKLQKESWKEILLVSFFGVFIGMWLLTEGQERVSSSVAGTLSSLIPLFVALLGTSVFFNRSLISNRGWLGIMVGFLGAVIIYNPFGDLSINPLGFFLVIMSTFFLALEAQLIKKWFSGADILSVVALVVTWTGVIFTFSALPQAFQSGDWAILLLLALMSNVIAYFLYFWLVVKEGAVYANIASYLIPVIALFAGVLINSETLTPTLLLGAGGCLVGALLLGKKITKKNSFLS